MCTNEIHVVIVTVLLIPSLCHFFISWCFGDMQLLKNACSLFHLYFILFYFFAATHFPRRTKDRCWRMCVCSCFEAITVRVVQCVMLCFGDVFCRQGCSQLVDENTVEEHSRSVLFAVMKYLVSLCEDCSAGRSGILAVDSLFEASQLVLCACCSLLKNVHLSVAGKEHVSVFVFLPQIGTGKHYF